MGLWLWIIGSALLLFSRRHVVKYVSQAVQVGQEAAFAIAIASEARPYAAMILRVAKAEGVDPFLLVAIGQRESNWGRTLKPDGTGDCTSRTWKTAAPVRVVGTNLAGKQLYMPADGMCWGRGIMQLDYAWHEFARSGNWRDPESNVRYAAQHLKSIRAQLVKAGVKPELLTQATIAAYNRGVANVIKDMESGLSPEAKTTGGDYASWVLTRAGGYVSKFVGTIS